MRIRQILMATVIACSAYSEEVSFRNDVMPVFMRGGCNAGDCHGATRGKDGFMLSLFGYDPDGDYYRIVEDFIGRRLNLAHPEKSLLLEKTAGTVAHTGGEIFTPDDKHYQTLLQWIRRGAKPDSPDVALVSGIRVSSEKIEFERPSGTHDLRVTAIYSDGKEKDVTDLALFMSNDKSIAPVDESGRITALKPGGTHVFARFDKFTVGCEVIVLPDGQFVWSNPLQFNYIDRLIDERLKKLRIQPSGLCTDEQFLRRATIDLVGRLPTVSEYLDFVRDETSDKRAKLIDRLLESDDFAAIWAAKWGEWLKIRTDTNPQSGTAMKAGWNYYGWVRQQMIENRPWDAFATDLIEGNGSNLSNPPSNLYTMLPQGKLKPEKLGEDVAQIFLGVRTQCAQCHNHPFDRWTMDDYYSFTSFFTGVRRKHGREGREYFTYVEVDTPGAKHLVTKKEMPAAFLGDGPALVKGKDPRKVLARWMTSPDNRMFRRNLANRVWAHFFGRGIVDEVDDFRVSNPATNEALLEELGRRFAYDYAYDVRKLVRDVCNSRTYQLSAATNKSNLRDTGNFSRAYLRRLRADVLFDCIHQALGREPSFRSSTATRAVDLFEGGRRDSNNHYFLSTFGQAKRESVCACENITDANLSQALHLINGNTIQRNIERDSKLISDIVDEYRAPDAIIRHLYRRILTRDPTSQEMNRLLAAATDQKVAASAVAPDRKKKRKGKPVGDVAPEFYGDVIWALLNSSEFMFNH